jgi:hypothetical protein
MRATSDEDSYNWPLASKYTSIPGEVVLHERIWRDATSNPLLLTGSNAVADRGSAALVRAYVGRWTGVAVAEIENCLSGICARTA